MCIVSNAHSEKNPDSLDMKLPPGFSVDTMEQVIKCLYSRKLEVTSPTYFQLLPLSFPTP